MALNINGVDISYCQRGLSYEKLKEDGMQFAIIRAGYTGTSSHKQYRDDVLHTHVNGCLSVGIPFGFYFYSCARTPDEARAEAKFCAEQIKDYPLPEYPVFIDAEEMQIANTGKKNATDIVIAFIKEMESLGYPSGVYANPSWLEYYLDKSRLVNSTDIWLAHWVEKCTCKYNQTIWQNGLTYSAGMKIDSDICFIDYPAETRTWYEKHGKIAPTTISKKSVDEIISEIWRDLWGNGQERYDRLTAAGYNYYEIQDELDRRLAEQKAASTEKIKIGRSVMIKRGARTYTGGRLASFVYSRPHTVSEIYKDRAVVCYGKVVVAAVNIKDLTLA